MAKSKSVLRIAGGTLRVRLSANHNQDLILDRELVATHCPTLAPRLRQPGESRYASAWDNSKLMNIDGTKDAVRVTTLALNPADGTFLLDGHVNCMPFPEVFHLTDLLQDFVAPPENSFYTFFMESDLASPVWTTIIDSVYQDPSQANENSIHTHTVLFRLLHGYAEGLFLDASENYPFLRSREFARLLDVCALADFYGCLEVISDAVVDTLTKANMFWRLVNREPIAILRLAVKLEAKELYQDAWRHLMGRLIKDSAPKTWTQEICRAEHLLATQKHFGLTRDELLAQLQELKAEQDPKITDLSASLRTLQLNPSFARQDGRDYPVRTSFFNLLRLPFSSRKQRTLKGHTARFLAGSIYSQWLTQQELGDQISGSSQPRSSPAGPFDVAVSKLEHFATTRSPSDVFGHGAVQAILSTLGLEHATKDVTTELNHMVVNAAELIKQAFMTREGVHADETFTYRRAHWHGDHHGYFTYLPMNETAFPWGNADDLEQSWEDAMEKAEESRHDSERERQSWEEWEIARLQESR